MRTAAQPATSIVRQGSTTTIRVHGDVVIPTVQALDTRLRAVNRRWWVKRVVLDFADVGRLDSAGVAVIQIARRSLGRSGKQLAFEHLDPRHRAAFELGPSSTVAAHPNEVPPGWFERIGNQLWELGASTRALVALISETLHQTWLVITRRARLPAGSLAACIVSMGVDAVFIVALLSFLLGTTIAFQGAVQLQRFGASVFVADMVSMSMVREFAPMMTAIVLDGPHRRSDCRPEPRHDARRLREIDALASMGVSPFRYLVVPRVSARAHRSSRRLRGDVVDVRGNRRRDAGRTDVAQHVPIIRSGRRNDRRRLTLADFRHRASARASCSRGSSDGPAVISACATTGDASSVRTRDDSHRRRRHLLHNPVLLRGRDAALADGVSMSAPSSDAAIPSIVWLTTSSRCSSTSILTIGRNEIDRAARRIGVRQVHPDANDQWPQGAALRRSLAVRRAALRPIRCESKRPAAQDRGRLSAGPRCSARCRSRPTSPYRCVS